jgi:glycosyltransferase involved in cell wall biosynthesis
VISKSNAVFYYMTDGYQTSGKSLMGRQSAGEGFLKGFARHAGVDMFYCYAPDNRQFQHFKQTVSGVTGKNDVCTFIPYEQFTLLSRIGCLYLPGPGLSKDAWVRRAFNSRAYSLCGITHTTATDRVMDSFGTLMIDPVQSWDAIVCTSTVVRKTVERVIGWYGDYLQERMGVRPDMPVQLPIIPLGVDCDQYADQNSGSYRATWRDKLEVSDNDIAVLYMGRLSFTTKAHPLPMAIALEEAARKTKRKVCLILAGWFDPPASETVWKEDVKKFCPSVNVVFLDGRDMAIRKEIWSAADIFVSLSDNIQETFGLTPIEAMAAGLPVVVSDWDGYHDTVRHGIDGFRIPVYMPGPGAGEDLALRYANQVDSYGSYCGTVNQMTSVDIGACVEAFSALIKDKALRSKMGTAGRQRARYVYDWSVVVGMYQDLWTELAQRRMLERENAPLKKGKPSHPLRLDPFALFQEYPTGHITGKSVITLQGSKIPGWVEHVNSSVMNTYIRDQRLLLTTDEQGKVLEHMQEREQTAIADILKIFPDNRKIVALRSIAWMCKRGLLALVRPKTPS